MSLVFQIVRLLEGVFSNSEKFSNCTKMLQRNSASLLKKRLWHRCFSVNFLKFLRTPFLTKHLGWLLLKTIVLYLHILSIFKKLFNAKLVTHFWNVWLSHWFPEFFQGFPSSLLNCVLVCFTCLTCSSVWRARVLTVLWVLYVLTCLACFKKFACFIKWRASKNWRAS